jgi:hypothetical protein
MNQAPPASARRLRWVQLGCLLAGVVAVLPSVRAGFFADDYLQIAQLEGWSTNPAGPLDLYSFVPRDAVTVERLRQQGSLPYFAAPGLQIAFFRPLASALMWVDHALFARSPVPYHLHTLLWYAALLVMAAVLLRGALPPGLATLALLIFCLDGGHAMAAAWIAARNATVACALVFAAFVAHRRWRTAGWRPGALLAPLAAALGLGASEMALGALGYLLAWEMIERRPRRSRAVAPVLLVMAVYLVVYQLTSSGAHASGAYLDPFGAPATFLRALPGRVLLLLGSLLGAAPIDLVSVDGRLRVPLVAAGAALGAIVAGWLPGALRRMSPDEAKAVRWLGLGAAASLLVSTPALPGDRVLLAASLGGSAVLAALLRDAWRLLRARRARVAAALGLVLLGLPNLALAAVALPAKVLLLRALAEDSRRLGRQAEIAAPVPARVVVLALDDLVAIHLPLLRVFDQGMAPEDLRRLAADRAHAGGLPLPDRIGYLGSTVLSLSAAPHRLRRTAADAFELFTPAGTLLDGTWAECLRARGLPLGRGSVLRVDGMTATVLDDRDGRPTRVEFRFDRPLEDPALVFLALIDHRLRRFPWPAIGGEVTVPHLRPL